MDSILKVAELVDAGNKKQQKDLESLSLEVDLIKDEYESRIAIINKEKQDLLKKQAELARKISEVHALNSMQEAKEL
jgi:aromatic ring hydroxylase